MHTAKVLGILAMASRTGAAMTLILASLLTEQVALGGTIRGRIRAMSLKTDLSDFVVSVENVKGQFPLPAKPAVIDQKNLKFVPHILVIQAGRTVEFRNSDPVFHNVYSISRTKLFNLGLFPQGVVRRMKFDKPGVVHLRCDVHPGMSGYIVIVENPYFAVSGHDGTFQIADVPPGQHHLHFWHEGFRSYSEGVKVPREGTLRVRVNVKKGLFSSRIKGTQSQPQQ